MKLISTAFGLALLAGAASPSFAQNAPLSGGATNPPPGTTGNNNGTPVLPGATTNTPKAGALDSTSVTGAQAAAQSKFEEAGYSNVKGLSRSPDGVWTGRGVKDGVEVGLAMDPTGRITQQ